MEKIKICKQVVIGWGVLDCPCDYKPGKVVEPIVSLVGRAGDDRFQEEHSYLSAEITAILPAAPGTYRVTTIIDGELVILGISHPGDGLRDEYWLACADEQEDVPSIVES